MWNLPEADLTLDRQRLLPQWTAASCQMSRDRAARPVKPVTRGKCFTVTENDKYEGDEATREDALVMFKCKKGSLFPMGSCVKTTCPGGQRPEESQKDENSDCDGAVGLW